MVTTYAERLSEAMGLSAQAIAEMSDQDRLRIKALADHLGITYTAITKYFRDGSNFMSAPNNAKTARFLRVDADWLALGEGAMRSGRVWPFGDRLKPAEYFALPQEAVEPALDVLVAAVERNRKREGTHG